MMLVKVALQQRDLPLTMNISLMVVNKKCSHTIA